MRYREVDGRYFDEENEKRAARIERRAERRAERLERRAERRESRGKDIGDLRERAGEMRQSVQDIRDMRKDESTEYQYSNLSSDEAKRLGLIGPTATATGMNEKGDNVVTMFTERNMGSKIHETRHGGQNARGELDISTGQGYGVADEVSAYRAQYSWAGKLQYIPYTNFDEARTLQLLTKGIGSFKEKINNVNQITPGFVNSLVDNPGIRQILIYPPKGLNLKKWNSN